MAPRSTRSVLLTAFFVCGAVTQAFVRLPAPPISSPATAAATARSHHAHRHPTTRLFMTAAAYHNNPLSLEEISQKIKFEVTDLDAGAYGLESKDVAYAGACECVYFIECWLR